VRLLDCQWGGEIQRGTDREKKLKALLIPAKASKETRGLINRNDMGRTILDLIAYQVVWGGDLMGFEKKGPSKTGVVSSRVKGKVRAVRSRTRTRDRKDRCTSRNKPGLGVVWEKTKQGTSPGGLGCGEIIFVKREPTKRGLGRKLNSGLFVLLPYPPEFFVPQSLVGVYGVEDGGGRENCQLFYHGLRHWQG